MEVEDGIRDASVTGVQTCALRIWKGPLLLVCWRKSYGAVIDESLKAAVVPNVPHPAVAAARRKCHWSAVAWCCIIRALSWALRGNQSESRMLEMGTSGLMSGEGKQPAACRPRSSALPRLYGHCSLHACRMHAENYSLLRVRSTQHADPELNKD